LLLFKCVLKKERGKEGKTQRMIFFFKKKKRKKRKKSALLFFFFFFFEKTNNREEKNGPRLVKRARNDRLPGVIFDGMISAQKGLERAARMLVVAM
jgi:hypothetical protein